MKNNTLIILALGLLLVSCSKSNEKKAEELAEEAVKKALYIPESYDPVSLQLDSAFAPYDDVAYRSIVLEMMQSGIAIKQAQENLSQAESNMAIWSGDYQTEFGKVEYKQAKDKYDKAQLEVEKITQKALEQKERYLELKSQKPEFIGFKAVHTYRAKNNSGNVLMGNVELLFDKEITQVTNMFDMDSEEYQMFVEGEKMFAEQLQ